LEAIAQVQKLAVGFRYRSTQPTIALAQPNSDRIFLGYPVG